ncbi:AraC family transcriptional regulator [Parapedobacter sp. ISTM3]|uniref:AraC family transcriptional regulator n=1 Tax=Parapedobacter sp. ISTM3 TaxID=2800130 RepID=UPI001903747E|nr:helix-turn-helix domain-containing protein [Parapedobacter sp. ISTM3]MBK1440960.1 AraC family transcriptional regulator [Parapedobacter sp. ISTM3]
MKPTVAIRFPALSDPEARAIVETDSDEITATAKTATIVHYRQMVVNIDTPATTHATVTISETGLYLFVLIKGQLLMKRTDTADIPVSSSANHCQSLYLCKGDYAVTFSPGRHRLVYFASATAWIRRIKQTLPIINEISGAMLPHQEAIIFPNYPLPDAFAKHLLAITYQSANETLATELDHFHNLNRIMAHYDHLLAETIKKSATRRTYTHIVREFINRCNQSLLLAEFSCVETIAAAMHVSPKTLNRAFHRVSKGTISPGRMLLNLRMATAHELLSQNGPISVQEVAHLMGYADKSTFSKAYRRVFGHLPSEASTVRNIPPHLSVTNYLPNR